MDRRGSLNSYLSTLDSFLKISKHQITLIPVFFQYNWLYVFALGGTRFVILALTFSIYLCKAMPFYSVHWLVNFQEKESFTNHVYRFSGLFWPSPWLKALHYKICLFFEIRLTFHEPSLPQAVNVVCEWPQKLWFLGRPYPFYNAVKNFIKPFFCGR